MTEPARRGDIRLKPADRRALSKDSYELRAPDGRFVCAVGREKAWAGIVAGVLEIWKGRSGIYLRSANLGYPDSAREPRPGMCLMNIPKGAVQSSVSGPHRRAASGLVGSIRSRRVSISSRESKA